MRPIRLRYGPGTSGGRADSPTLVECYIRESFAFSLFCPTAGRPAAECISPCTVQSPTQNRLWPPLTPPMSNRHSPSVKPVLLSHLRKVKSRAPPAFTLSVPLSSYPGNERVGSLPAA